MDIAIRKAVCVQCAVFCFLTNFTQWGGVCARTLVFLWAGAFLKSVWKKYSASLLKSTTDASVCKQHCTVVAVLYTVGSLVLGFQTVGFTTLIRGLVRWLISSVGLSMITIFFILPPWGFKCKQSQTFRWDISLSGETANKLLDTRFFWGHNPKKVTNMCWELWNLNLYMSNKYRKSSEM